MHHRILNDFFDHLVHLRISIFHRDLPSYQFFGYTGLILAVILGFILVYKLNLSYLVVGLLIITAIITFFTLAMITKIIVGEERHIYYHHEIALLITSSFVLLLFDQPVLVYLDIVALGLGMFLTFGRIGCLMVGCCHGIPNEWGIRYNENHVDEGFTNYLKGVRLFPIQAMELMWVFIAVIIGSYIILYRYNPGEALAFYIMFYGTGRFCFEFARGDPERPYFFGFSEAQWTTLFLMLSITGLELSGIIQFNLFHAVLTAFAPCLMIFLSIKNRINKGSVLLQPVHIKELIHEIHKLDSVTFYERGGKTRTNFGYIPMISTSFGIQISSGQIRDRHFLINHYAVCHQDRKIHKKTVWRLGKMIQTLMHPASVLEIRQGKSNVFHLLFHVR